MSKEQLTPHQKFKRYLTQMLRWQSLPRGSAERYEAVQAWLEQGQHMGGKAPVSESSTEEGERIKRKRTGWKLGWRKRIRNDPELVKLADKAGVLDKPRADVQPGDFADPDPRNYKPIVFPDASPAKDEPPPSVTPSAWSFFWRRKDR